MKTITIIASRLIWITFAVVCGPAILLGSALACPTSARVRGHRRLGFLFAGAAYYAVGAAGLIGLSRRVLIRSARA